MHPSLFPPAISVAPRTRSLECCSNQAMAACNTYKTNIANACRTYSGEMAGCKAAHDAAQITAGIIYAAAIIICASIGIFSLGFGAAGCLFAAQHVRRLQGQRRGVTRDKPAKRQGDALDGYGEQEDSVLCPNLSSPHEETNKEGRGARPAEQRRRHVWF